MPNSTSVTSAAAASAEAVQGTSDAERQSPKGLASSISSDTFTQTESQDVTAALVPAVLAGSVQLSYGRRPTPAHMALMTRVNDDRRLELALRQGSSQTGQALGGLQVDSPLDCHTDAQGAPPVESSRSGVYVPCGAPLSRNSCPSCKPPRYHLLATAAQLCDCQRLTILVATTCSHCVQSCIHTAPCSSYCSASMPTTMTSAAAARAEAVSGTPDAEGQSPRELVASPLHLPAALAPAVSPGSAYSIKDDNGETHKALCLQASLCGANRACDSR